MTYRYKIEIYCKNRNKIWILNIILIFWDAPVHVLYYIIVW